MYRPALEPNDLEKFFVERANAGDVEGLVALYEPNAVVSFGDGKVAKGLNQIREFFIEYVANKPQLDPSNQSPALCGGDLALTSSRTSNGDITAEIARRQPDGSWLWVVDQFALCNEIKLWSKGLGKNKLNNLVLCFGLSFVPSSALSNRRSIPICCRLLALKTEPNPAP